MERGWNGMGGDGATPPRSLSWSISPTSAGAWSLGAWTPLCLLCSCPKQCVNTAHPTSCSEARVHKISGRESPGWDWITSTSICLVLETRGSGQAPSSRPSLRSTRAAPLVASQGFPALLEHPNPVEPAEPILTSATSSWCHSPRCWPPAPASQ